MSRTCGSGTSRGLSLCGEGISERVAVMLGRDPSQRSWANRRRAITATANATRPACGSPPRQCFKGRRPGVPQGDQECPCRADPSEELQSPRRTCGWPAQRES